MRARVTAARGIGLHPWRPGESVVLLEDLPSDDLVRGRVGAVVEALDEDHFGFDFVDVSGRTYGLTTLVHEAVSARATMGRDP